MKSDISGHDSKCYSKHHRLALILICSLLCWCGSCSDDPGAPDEDPADHVYIAAGTVDVSGGTIRIDDPQNPLDGLEIVFPPGTVSGNCTVTVNTVGTPLPLDGEFSGFAGTPIDIRATTGTFAQPVRISLPVTIELGDTLLPIGSTWDESLQAWIPLVSAYNETHGVVTISVNHFSVYAPLTIDVPDGLATALEAASEVRTLCAELIEEVQGEVRCAVLNRLSSELALIRDTSEHNLETAVEVHEWCVDYLCPDIDDIATYIVEETSEIIVGTSAGALLTTVGGAAAAQVFAVVGILVAAPCALCTLSTANINPGVLQAWVSYTVADMALELIERTIDDPGCVENDFIIEQVETLNLDGFLWDLLCVGDIAYVASSVGIHVVDISNPEDLHFIATFAPDLVLTSLAFDANYLFAINQEVEAELHIFDISAPQHLVHRGQIAIPRAPGTIVAENQIVYLAEMSQGLHVIDVSSPGSPAIVGQLGGFDFALDIAVYADHAWISEYAGELVAVDISDPTHPARLGSISADSTSIVVTTVGIGMFGDRDNRAVFFEPSQPNAPVVLGSVATNGEIYRGDLDSEKAVLYEIETGFAVVDLANPSQPNIDDRLSHSGYVEGISVLGDFAIVAERLGQLSVLRLQSHQQARVD